MRIDYHTHHVRCGHAEGTLEQYIQQAVQIGLDQIGVSDHMPLLHVDPATYLPGMAMPMEELPRYFEEAQQLKEKYRGTIDVRIGLEGDYIEGYEEQIERIVNGYEWDYVIGSVHFLGEWDITDFRQLSGWESRHIDEVYELYYEAMTKAAKTGFYTYMGHLDVVKRYAPTQPTKDHTDLIETTLRTIRDNDLAIEINASGLRMTVGETFPNRAILERCKALDIPVTLGSDAHLPERVGQYLDQAEKLLKEVGYGELATFSQKERFMVQF
ncbi:histidinol-phosphatase HisJ [Paenibacillus thermotolerans]|uniref:histidinol-phosphatase HisJ n=1 Tax=Paenibacillus thermotolerans TaxID=3027807 RepID=UPI00236876D7|nr:MULTISPECIES: histidinol-phosphatase HisJ [unclassified Paenibacillus]